MLNVGLTGGIASGKSTVARMLAAKGALIIDLDELAHIVEEPGGAVWAEIVRHFGEEILNADRKIDRQKLGAIVFSDPEKRKLLNRLVHPAVLEAWHRRLNEIRFVSPEAVVLSDIPLLVEAGMEKMVDLVLLVYLPREKQIARLMKRDGYNRSEAEMRIASQMPIEEKKLHADIVISNEVTEEETQAALDNIWEELTKRAKLHH
jgi:dephospho-CoA kinase